MTQSQQPSNEPSPQQGHLQVGSSLQPLYVERRMKVYAITESEFNSLSTLNSQTTIFSSVGFAILSAGISIWINALFYTDVPAPAYVAMVYIAPATIVLALVFFYLALRASGARESSWVQIKNESGATDSVVQ